MKTNYTVLNTNEEVIFKSDNIKEVCRFLRSSETHLRKHADGGIYKLPLRNEFVEVITEKVKIDYKLEKEKKKLENFNRTYKALLLEKGYQNVKQVPGVEGLYACKDGTIYKVNCKGEVVRCYESVTKGACKLYYRVSYKKIDYLISRLVAKTFLDDSLVLNDLKDGKRITGLDVDHIDNDTSNNTLTNLQILSHSDNLLKRASEIGGWGKQSKQTYVYNNETRTFTEFDRLNEAGRWICERENKNYNPGYAGDAINNGYALFKKYGLGYSKAEAKANARG